MELGERLYQLRRERRMSQEALADALGVSRQSVSKWENGASTPDLDKLVRLGELFEMCIRDSPYTGRPVYQATAFCSRKEDPLLRALLPTGCKLARWSEGGVDIIPEAGGKAAGMRRFLTRFGLSRLECMAFGDAENDLDMLAYAGIGVAMGNASEAVKHAADYVTASVDEKGIEQALRHFRLI